MNKNLFEAAKEHIIIAAHRGVAGGNIPCNTKTAYEIALAQGADMLETDVSKNADGTLVIFHPGMEEVHLKTDKRIPDLSDEQMCSLRYVNYNGAPTQFGLMSFEAFLETYKDRCYINVDKFWDNPEEIYFMLKKHNMLEQCVVKSVIREDVLSVLEKVAPDVPFMPIVKETHPRHNELMERNINYIGAEVLFSSDDSDVVSGDFIDRMHGDGKIVWVNSLIYNYKVQLAAGHSDDTALSEDPDKGWGWLADRKFDVIQTDWPLMLINYLKESGRYYRK